MTHHGDRGATRRSVRLTSRAPLVGREVELDLLQQAVDRTIAGRSGTMVVRGDPGAGKTRLIDEVTARNEHRAIVLTARCSQMATGPLTPAISLLDQASGLPDAAQEATSAAYGSLPGLLDRLHGRAGDPTGEAAANGDALARASCLALLDAVKRRPSIIVIDDAHWADPRTAAFLEQLCTEVSYARRDQPVLAVVSARSIDPDDTTGIVLERVDRMARSMAIDLRPLSEMDLRDLLVGHGVPNPDRRFVTMMSEVSRGNPLFVREALRQIDARGAFHSVAGRTATRLSAQDLAPPRELEELVDRRLSDVDPRISEMLSMAAVVDDTIDPRLLVGLGYDAGELDDLIDEAESIDLLSWTGSALEFSHSVIRQVLYARLGRRRRQRLHRQVAATIRAGVPDAEVSDRAVEIAHHLLRSGPLDPDLDDLTMLWLAGREAFRSCSWSDATRFLEAALDMAPSLELGPDDLGWLLYWTGRCSDHDGAHDRATELLERAADVGRRTGDTSLWARSALNLAKQQKVTGAAALAGQLETVEIERALDALGDTEAGLRARLMDEYCQIVLQAGDTDAGVAAADEASRLAHESGDPRIVAMSDATVGLSLLACGEIGGARDRFGRARTLARQHGADMTNLWSTLRLALAEWLGGDIGAAERSLADVTQLLALAPNGPADCLAHAIAASAALARGDLHSAELLGERAERLFELTNYSFAPLILFPALIESRAAQGDVEGAHAAIDRWEASGHIGHQIAAVGFDARRGHSATDVALQTVLDLADMLSTGSLLAPSVFGAVAEYSVAHRTTDPLGSIGPDLADLGAGGARFGPGFGTSVERTKGLAAEAAGHLGAAQHHYDAAITSASATGCLPELARSHLGMARTLFASDDDDGEGHVASALDLSRRLGLVETSGRALDLYHSLGERPPPDRAMTARDTLALLMTDIVGSTRLSVEEGDVAYLEVVDLHDRIMRRHLAPHGGTEVDTTGDGMLASFDRAVDAVRCALAVQRAVEAHNESVEHSSRPPLHVRAGVGVGNPINRAGRLYGTAVNRTARLCAEADAGQIAIDDVVRQLLDDDVASRFAGTVALKGFTDPTPVHLVSV